MDKAGNFYGVTADGGDLACFGGSGCGTVFELGADGDETTLFTFTGAGDGAYPFYGLVRDEEGNLFGITTEGGDLSCPFASNGCGVVFEISSAGVFTVLHAFAGGADGSDPGSELLLDSAGNLYGTTYYGGGATGCGQMVGCGTVFKIDNMGNETVLYRFLGGRDGANPSWNLALDTAGNLYGITGSGGDLHCKETRGNGCGAVFKLDPNGILTVLHTFTGGADGASPSGLVRDSAGNLYGTTLGGGGQYCKYRRSTCGTVFKIDVSGNETILHAFAGGADGTTPTWLTLDQVGNLYGTTVEGGAGKYCSNFGCGTIYRIALH